MSRIYPISHAVFPHRELVGECKGLGVPAAPSRAPGVPSLRDRHTPPFCPLTQEWGSTAPSYARAARVVEPSSYAALRADGPPPLASSPPVIRHVAEVMDGEVAAIPSITTMRSEQ